MDEETFTLLRTHQAANVWISSLRMPQDYTITSDFVYLRFHGLKDGAYHDYTDDELRPWAKQLQKAAERDIPSYVYFNNDLNTRAPLNAEALMRLIGEHTVPAFEASLAKALEIQPPQKKPETWPTWNRTRTTRHHPPRKKIGDATPRRRPATASTG
jgi:uncharacterized protein YecE (DUF72 family)